MSLQTMNLKESKGEFVASDAQGDLVKQIIHSAGVVLGGFLVSVLLVSLEGRKLYT